MKNFKVNQLNSHISLRNGQANTETKSKVSIPKTIKLKGGKYNGGK